MIINQGEKQDAREPSQRRLPTKPMQFFRHDIGDFELFDDIKPATVDHPNILVCRVFTARGRGDLFQLRKPSIQPGKIIGRADPQYAGEHMRPAQNEVTRFPKVHRTNPEYPALSSAKAPASNS